MMVYFQFFLILVFLFLIFSYKDFVLKVLLIIFWSPLLPLFAYSIDVPLVGAFGISKFDNEVSQYALNLCLIGNTIFYALLWKIRNVRFKYVSVKIRKQHRYILFLLLLLSSIPILNTHTENGGSKSATFFIVFNTILLVSTKKKDIVWYGQLIVLLFLIATGERVDGILFLLCMFIIKDDRSINSKELRKLYMVLPIALALLVYIGATRGGGSFSIDVLTKSLYSQQTITDVAYVYTTGVDYYLNNGSNTSVLLNLFGGLFPGPTGGIPSIYNYRNILNDYMPNAGGGLFYTEGMLAFGGLGVCLYIAIFAIAIRKLYVGGKRWKSALFLLLFCMACRIIWYGLIYSYKPIILFLLSLFAIETMQRKRNIKLQQYGEKYNNSK